MPLAGRESSGARLGASASVDVGRTPLMWGRPLMQGAGRPPLA